MDASVFDRVIKRQSQKADWIKSARFRWTGKQSGWPLIIYVPSLSSRHHFFSPSAQLRAARDVLRWWAHLNRVMEMMLRAVFLHALYCDDRRAQSCVWLCFSVWWVLMEWVREVKFILGERFCCDSFLTTHKSHRATANVWIRWFNDAWTFSQFDHLTIFCTKTSGVNPVDVWRHAAFKTTQVSDIVPWNIRFHDPFKSTTRHVCMFTTSQFSVVFYLGINSNVSFRRNIESNCLNTVRFVKNPS